MTRQRMRGSVALIAAILATGFLLTPAATAANLVTTGTGGSCVALQGPPPWGIVVNPECKPLGVGPLASSQNGLSADANLTGQDVEVTWTLETTDPEIDGFRILRGATPYAMETVGTTQLADRAFIDSDATWSGEAIWYAVQAVDSGGEVVITSQPVLVEPGV